MADHETASKHIDPSEATVTNACGVKATAFTEVKVTRTREIIATEKEDGDRENLDGLPVDCGWSWIIMAGHFVMTLVKAGYARSLSLFLMEFVTMFDSSVTTVTLTFAVMVASFGLGNVLVTHVLLPRFDTRHVILTGAVTGSLAVVVSSVAPDIGLIIFLHAVLGLAHAMSYTSSATLMGPYFKARRGLANAVSNTGVSVSALLIPPVTQYFITSYGTRGALLLVAGVQMQAIVAGCLMRPVEFYVKTEKWKRWNLKENTDRTEEEIRHLTDNSDCELHIQPENQNEDIKIEGISKKQTPEFYHPQPELNLDKTILNSDHSILQNRSRKQCCNDRNTSSFITDLKKKTSSEKDKSLDCSEQDSTFSKGDVENSEVEAAHHLLSKADETHIPKPLPTSSGSEITAQREDISVQIENNDFRSFVPGRESTKAESRGNLSVYSEVDTKAPVHTTSVSTFSEHDVQSGTIPDKVTASSVCVTALSKVVDVTLFKNWLFILLVTYYPLGQTNIFLGVFLPALGVEKGLSRPEAALLLTVMGAVDLVSRLCLGYLADTGLVRRTRIVAVALAVLSTSCMCASLYTDFGRLAAFSVMFGMCGGTNHNLMVVVVVELLGLPHLSKTLGLLFLTQSLFLSLTNPVLGALVDWTGSFVVTLQFVGACLLLAVLILTAEPLARRLENRRVCRLQAGSGDETQPN